jgi:hypothetical protein
MPAYSFPLGVPITINSGSSATSFVVDLSAGPLISNLTFDGVAGYANALSVMLPTAGGAVTLMGNQAMVPNVILTYSNLATLNILGGAGNDQVTQLSATPVGTAVAFQGGGGNNQLNLLGGTFTLNAAMANSSTLAVNDQAMLDTPRPRQAADFSQRSWGASPALRADRST